MACENCQPGEGEWFRWGMVIFRVTPAIESVNARMHPLRRVDWKPESDLCYINDEHLGHVDPTIPGIVAMLTFKAKRGRPAERFPILIDGHHRAARCNRDGLPFNCYVLTDQESYALIDQERCRR